MLDLNFAILKDQESPRSFMRSPQAALASGSEDITDETRAAAVLEAARASALDALDLLVEGGASPNFKEDGTGLTPLHYACRLAQPPHQYIYTYTSVVCQHAAWLDVMPHADFKPIMYVFYKFDPLPQAMT